MDSEFGDVEIPVKNISGKRSLVLGTASNERLSRRSNHSTPLHMPSVRNEEAQKEFYYTPQDGTVSDYETFFKDRIRRVDMVLAYTDDTSSSNQAVYRTNFELNLLSDGLELELENKANSSSGDVYFLKIHAPWEVLTRYAEVLNLKMPLKVDNDDDDIQTASNGKGMIDKLMDAFFPSASTLNQVVETRTAFLTAPFMRSRANNFAIKSPINFFLPSQRSMIVWYILNHTQYKNKKDTVGIIKLLNKGVYKACFPLHDGDFDSTAIPTPTRALLYQTWGSAKVWYWQQPLPQIRDYFGDKVGLYFAWMGAYTMALAPAAIVGVLCFLYGVFSMNSETNVMSHELCNTEMGNLTMCPLCNEICAYWKLGESCVYSKVSYLFDNYATCFFSIFMSIWATGFLEFWKRRQARLSWEWDLMETGYIDDEEIRPEYESQAHEYRISPVTKRREPYIPQSKRAVRYIVSGASIIAVCSCLLIAMLLIIIYRLVVITSFSQVDDQTVLSYAKFFASSSAALLHVIMITAFKPVGRKLAHILTEFEAPRTQSEYEDNFAIKVFAFEFVNVYSSLIYIAIFKGRFYVHPGDREASDFNVIRTEACDPSGCFFELCIQMAVIMIGRQISNNLVEIFLPKLQIWWRNRSAYLAKKERHSRGRLTRWETDYNLQAVDRLSFYEEYNEMVIQYGLVTLFVAAFPLAPLFALVNNVIEIRLDAYKIITQFRRPVAQRVADIGVWMEILKVLTFFAVISNAFVIAFSSEFVPRFVHFYMNNFDHSGYLNFTLSVFNTSFYQEGTSPRRDVDNSSVPLCFYRAMRNPSDDPDNPHQLTMNYWYTFAARLMFIITFEHLVIALTAIIAYIIPDIPASVRDKFARERLLEREALVGHDTDINSASFQGESVLGTPI